MWIRTMRLRNWLRFQGTHEIQLRPTVYGVVGEWVGLEDRSNWVGKTALLEAMRFAVTGEHRKRTEDEWITTGEEEGSIELTLSDGSVITRARKCGGPTTIKLITPDGKTAIKEPAEELIRNRVLGCTREEFDLLFYTAQTKLAEVVHMTPESFAEMIRQWVGTGVLEEMEVEACRTLGTASTTVATLEETIVAAMRDARECVFDGDPDEEEAADPNPQTTISRWVRLVSERESKAEKAKLVSKVALDKATERMHAYTEWWRHKTALDTLEGTRGEIRKLESLLSSVDKVELELGEAEILKEQESIDRSRHNNKTALDRVEALSQGSFDGICPLLLSDCPARDHVLKEGLRNKELLVTWRGAYETCVRKSSVARTKLSDIRERLSQIEKWESTLSALKKELARGLEYQRYCEANPQPGEANSSEYTNEVVALQEVYTTARLEHQKWTDVLNRLKRRLDDVEKAQKNIGSAKIKMARYNRIRRVVGRQGAQRDIALSSMRQVELLGNGSLLSEIPLTFKIRWTSEGKKLSASCDACGYAYSGQRDKVCPRCKKPRYMQALDRPGLELSDQSGAADDLVGAALRLGASAWLRKRRAMPWGVAVLDEPFGQLDGANREVFARYLTHSLQAKFGFEQAFIVAHHEDVMAAMPGRIRVVGTQHGSRVEVVN